MRIVTCEDIRDVYVKSIQKGYGFLFSKLSFSGTLRTKSSFNQVNATGSYWWTIPRVKKRWNLLITGDAAISYEEHVTSMLKNETPVRMISIGSGICSHELTFARLNPDWEITCLDFSEKLLQKAQETAVKEGLTNMKFINRNIYTFPLPGNYYTIVLFHSSLHHFRHLHRFIPRIHTSLTPGGKLIINEYVGASRLQYPKEQLMAINQCLNLIDANYRTIYKTKLQKRGYYGSGLLRMILSDPSEGVESERILPILKQHFKVIEEKAYGGNLLMPVLKDISHHFITPDEAGEKCIQRIFDYEDAYLREHKSDFVFGIYEKTQ
jgi:ubiquinone/menaquinone biosynthesis C-methylase UbiE